MSYQPFLIANYRSGIDDSVDPWILPNQAFTYLDNCYIRKGIVSKRNGISVFSQAGNRATGNRAHSGVQNYAGTLAPLTRKSLVITSGAQTIQDNGNGGFTGSGSGSINYDTGAYNITFTNNTTANISFLYHTPSNSPVTGIWTFERNQAQSQDQLIVTTSERFSFYDVRGFFSNIPDDLGSYNIFTSSNLVWFENYEDKCWFTNFHATDGIRYYDGTNIKRLVAQTGDTSAVKVNTCLMLFSYRDRLLMLNTEEDTSGGAGVNFPQRARWSQSGNPMSWRDDSIGLGGWVDAPTNDEIVSAVFIRDTLFVYFENSVWALRYTGNPDLPFRWDLISDTNSCNTTYGTIRYDKFATTVGKKSLFALDGAQTFAFDKKIPDFVLDINQKYASKVFGDRVNRLDQSWLCYPQQPTAIENDRVLVYSIEDDAYSRYFLSIRCLGNWSTDISKTFNYYAGSTFNSLAGLTWGDQSLQEDYPIKLGGGPNGFVYHIEDEGSLSDQVSWTARNNFNFKVKTGKLNPFKESHKANLGYIDLFFQAESPDSSITVNFYRNESNSVYKSVALSLENTGETIVWKRIFVNHTAQSHQIEIMLSDSQLNGNSGLSQIELHGMRLWFKPAGRLI